MFSMKTGRSRIVRKTAVHHLVVGETITFYCFVLFLFDLYSCYTRRGSLLLGTVETRSVNVKKTTW